MREITCEERSTTWTPRMRDGTIVVGTSVSNFMGDGVWETEWFWADIESPALFERMRYGGDGWVRRENLEECRHWVVEDGDEVR